jgi:hypothetical protein
VKDRPLPPRDVDLAGIDGQGAGDQRDVTKPYAARAFRPRPTHMPIRPASWPLSDGQVPARCYDSGMSDRWKSRAKGGRRRFLVDGVIAVVAWVARGVRDSVLPILLTMLWNAVTRRPEQTGRSFVLHAEPGYFELKGQDVVLIRATASVTLDDVALKATGTVG